MQIQLSATVVSLVGKVYDNSYLTKTELDFLALSGFKERYYLDLVKIIGDNLTKFSPKELDTKVSLNNIIYKQLQEGYTDGSINHKHFNHALTVMAARLIKECFVMDGVQILGQVDPDYIKGHMLNDLTEDPIFVEEIGLLVIVIDKLLPYLEVDINVNTEKGKVYA